MGLLLPAAIMEPETAYSQLLSPNGTAANRGRFQTATYISMAPPCKIAAKEHLMRRLVSLFIASAIVLNAVSAEAAGWRRRACFNRAEANAAYACCLYPKYEGGFHARHLQNIGIPDRDIGIRGNGIMLNPW
jgi:hypothetical protein